MSSTKSTGCPIPCHEKIWKTLARFPALAEAVLHHFLGLRIPDLAHARDERNAKLTR
jgi:hypothetical protein